MKQGLDKERVLEFAEKFAALMTEADDLGISWKSDNHRTYVALTYADETGEAWAPEVIIGWNGRDETWDVLR